MRNAVLVENEKQANRTAAKVMRLTFFVFTVVYFLNAVGIFITDKTIMTIAYAAGSLCLWCPTILVNLLKLQGGWIKYVNVVLAVGLVTVTSITLTYHVVILYVYAIGIAGLYFSKKLNILASALTVAGVSAGQLAAFFLETLPDKNFPVLGEVIVYSVIPRGLVLIAVAALFSMLSNRTEGLLSNLLGAEQQKALLDSMTVMRENASRTSETLLHMVEELSEITNHSVQSNRRISEQAEQLLEGTTENTEAVEHADGQMQAIAIQLTELSDRNGQIALLAEQIGGHTIENQRRMEEATDRMKQIRVGTEDCERIISKLGEASQEIIGIIRTISEISRQTNILALNATIEAARAGESGRGFAVVAEQIQKLSEQTKEAVENIGRIVKGVVCDTEAAVAAMEQNDDLTRTGMESIEKANESTMLITSSNEQIAEQIRSIAQTTEILNKKSGEVAGNMNQISTNTQKNCEAVEQVAAASQENNAGTQGLAELVEQIERLSEEMKEVVGPEQMGETA